MVSVLSPESYETVFISTCVFVLDALVSDQFSGDVQY